MLLERLLVKFPVDVFYNQEIWFHLFHYVYDLNLRSLMCFERDVSNFSFLFVCLISNNFVLQCFGRCQTWWYHPTIRLCMWNSWRRWDRANSLWSREVSSCLPSQVQVQVPLHMDMLLIICERISFSMLQIPTATRNMNSLV